MLLFKQPLVQRLPKYLHPCLTNVIFDRAESVKNK